MHHTRSTAPTQWDVAGLRHVTQHAVLAAVLLLGCSGEKDCINEPGPLTPVYPTHHRAPDWSRDNRIAYEDAGVVCVRPSGSFHVDTSLVGIWVIDPDSGERQRILGFGNLPDWSPDGSQVAFVRNGQICTADADGSNPKQLTSAGANYYPDWSPNGELIAYDSNLTTEGLYIWIMLVDSSWKKRISAAPGRYPAWEPAGTRIAYTGTVHEDRLWRELFVLEPDGSNPVRLTYSEEEERHPQYSPDGQKIAYTRLGSGGPSQIWVMGADGSGPRAITTEGGSHPSWSPDGGRIVFVRDNPWVHSPENNVLWIVDLEVGEESQLTYQWPDTCP